MSESQLVLTKLRPFKSNEFGNGLREGALSLFKAMKAGVMNDAIQSIKDDMIDECRLPPDSSIQDICEQFGNAELWWKKPAKAGRN